MPCSDKRDGPKMPGFGVAVRHRSGIWLGLCPLGLRCPSFDPDFDDHELSTLFPRVSVHTVDGAGHNDLFEPSHKQKVIDALIEFVGP